MQEHKGHSYEQQIPSDRLTDYSMKEIVALEKQLQLKLLGLTVWMDGKNIMDK